MIKSYNWDDYHIYTERPLFTHEHLSYETIIKYIRLAYRETIIKNFSFIFRRIRRGIREGEFFWDIYYFLKFIFMPATNKTAPVDYYARKSWPIWDFKNNPVNPATYQKVGRSRQILGKKKVTIQNPVERPDF